jgi:hypothetical protein
MVMEIADSQNQIAEPDLVIADQSLLSFRRTLTLLSRPFSLKPLDLTSMVIT